MEVKVTHLQTLQDIALQYTGLATNAYYIGKANGLPVSDAVNTGDILTIPDDVEKDEQVLRYFAKLFAEFRFQPATGIKSGAGPTEQLEGISYWIVNQDFIVQ